MTFADLHCIIAISEEGSFTRAASRLFMSQPALSQRVQRIENGLKSALFIRGKNGLELTPSGRLMADMSKEILGIYNKTAREVALLSAETAKVLRIGIPPNQSRVFAPVLATEFPKIHPDIRLVFKNANSNILERAIAEGDLDVGLIHGPCTEDVQISYKPLFRNPFRIYLRNASPAAPLARQTGSRRFPVLSLRQLEDEPLGTTLPGMRTRMLIDRLFQKEGLTPNIIHEMSSFESLNGLADSGICSIIRPFALYGSAYSSCDTNRIFDIDCEGDACLEVGFAYRQDIPFLGIYRSVCDILEKCCADPDGFPDPAAEAKS